MKELLRELWYHRRPICRGLLEFLMLVLLMITVFVVIPFLCER